MVSVDCLSSESGGDGSVPQSIQIEDALYLIRFVKSLHDVPLQGDILDHAGVSQAHYECFSQYDQISIVSTPYGAARVDELLNAPAPERVIADKRAVCYRCIGEGTFQGNLTGHEGWCILTLLRMPQSIKGKTTLEAEGALVQRIEKSVPDSLRWLVLHSLAKREIYLMLLGKQLDGAWETLRDVGSILLSESTPVPAVRRLGTWITASPGFVPQDDAEYPHVSDLFAGIRIAGHCTQSPYRGCVATILDRQESFLTERDTEREPRFRRPLHLGFEVEVPILPRNSAQVLELVRAARRECGSGCCSFYLCQSFGEMNGQTDAKYLFGYGTSWLETSTGGEPLDVDLSVLRQTDGGAFVADHLNRVFGGLTSAWNNPVIASEFHDLIPVAAEVRDAVAKWAQAKADLDAGKDTEESEVREVTARTNLLLGAHVLEFAMGERLREDIMGRSHHIQLAKLNSTGFSKIAEAASFVVKDVLHAFGVPWHGVVIFGRHGDFKEYGPLSVVNCVLAGTFQPRAAHGLVHEAGHRCFRARGLEPQLLQEFYVANPEAKSDPRKFAVLLAAYAESFSDLFAYEFAFGRENVEAFVAATAHHFVDILGADRDAWLREAPHDRSALRDKVRSRAFALYMRLLTVVCYYHIVKRKEELRSSKEVFRVILQESTGVALNLLQDALAGRARNQVAFAMLAWAKQVDRDVEDDKVTDDLLAPASMALRLAEEIRELRQEGDFALNEEHAQALSEGRVPLDEGFRAKSGFSPGVESSYAQAIATTLALMNAGESGRRQGVNAPRQRREGARAR